MNDETRHLDDDGVRVANIRKQDITVRRFMTGDAIPEITGLLHRAYARQRALGLDPRGLIVAVMIAASASFATPIGYQTNMMVYGPGGYRFTDFLRVGIPLNLTTGLLASGVIPLIWPL